MWAAPSCCKNPGIAVLLHKAPIKVQYHQDLREHPTDLSGADLVWRRHLEEDGSSVSQREKREMRAAEGRMHQLGCARQSLSTP